MCPLLFYLHRLGGPGVPKLMSAALLKSAKVSKGWPTSPIEVDDFVFWQYVFFLEFLWP